MDRLKEWVRDFLVHHILLWWQHNIKCGRNAEWLRVSLLDNAFFFQGLYQFWIQNHWLNSFIYLFIYLFSGKALLGSCASCRRQWKQVTGFLVYSLRRGKLISNTRWGYGVCRGWTGGMGWWFAHPFLALHAASSLHVLVKTVAIFISKRLE